MKRNTTVQVLWRVKLISANCLYCVLWLSCYWLPPSSTSHSYSLKRPPQLKTILYKRKKFFKLKVTGYLGESPQAGSHQSRIHHLVAIVEDMGGTTRQDVIKGIKLNLIWVCEFQKYMFQIFLYFLIYWNLVIFLFWLSSMFRCIK